MNKSINQSINQSNLKMPSQSGQLKPGEEDLRKLLLAQIKVFKDRKWIDSTEENGFRSLLSSNKDEFVPSVKSLEAIKKRLKAIKKEKLKEQSKARKDSRHAKHDSDSVTGSSYFDGENQIDANDDRFKVYQPQEIMNKVTEDNVDRLFTEMCVFARMSFLQPPSCLHCAFKQSQEKDKDGEKATRNKYCQNLVVWRRNAKERICSESLDSNIFFVSCSTAQALMRSKTVQGFTWDKESQRVNISNQ